VLTIQKPVHIIWLIIHNLRDQHVFKGLRGSTILGIVISLKSLVKVRKCGLEIIIFRLDTSRYEIDLGL
jgi:hypothetical protein